MIFKGTMIISRTPLRISFVGGGSDLRAFYQHGYGSVVNTAINKYVYIIINKKFDDGIMLHYSGTELVRNVDEVQHIIIREVLKFCGIQSGLDIACISDLPASKTGSGLGASSSLTVGLLHALYAYQGESVSSEQLARDACTIERDILKLPGGKQDQYAAAYGGLNQIRFHGDERVEIEPIVLSQKQLHELNKKLLLFYTGMDTKSSAAVVSQIKRTEENVPILQTMVGLSEKLPAILLNNNFTTLGQMLHENWLHKQKLGEKITNKTIDGYYARALQAGATGGKILGSGGGGFLLLYCDEHAQDVVRRALSNLQEMPFKFETQGSRIVYKD